MALRLEDVKRLVQQESRQRRWHVRSSLEGCDRDWDAGKLNGAVGSGALVAALEDSDIRVARDGHKLSRGLRMTQEPCSPAVLDLQNDLLRLESRPERASREPAELRQDRK